MSDIKEGDQVRIVAAAIVKQFKVASTSKMGVDTIVWLMGNEFDVRVPASWLEKVEPPFAVGQVIKLDDKEPPVGTVVGLNSSFHRVAVRDADRWSITGYATRFSWEDIREMNSKIIALPEDAR